MNITIKSFARRILEAVRSSCEEKGIRQGAIGICVSPVRLEETMWCNIPVGVSEVQFISSVIPFSDTALYFEKEGYVGDAAGIVAMKIAAAKRIMVEYADNDMVPPRKNCASGSVPEHLLGDGIVDWKGAIVVPIDRVDTSCCNITYSCSHPHDVRALNVYVAVSGGTEEDDEAAAWAALGVINEILDDELDYKLADGF